MKRREFITLLGGAAAAWPLAAQAQGERVRRIGVLMNRAADNPEWQAHLGAFQQALQQLGWSEGRNVRIDVRWGGTDADRQRRYAQELVTLAPDIFLASGTASVTALQQVTRALPIVFVGVADPVGAGFIDNLARPAGNVTGFMNYEYGFSGKWLELLKQIAPGLTRAAVIRNPALANGIGQFSVIQAVAPLLGMEVSPRARRGSLRPLGERRPHRDAERIGGSASRPDHYARGPAQAARGLLRSLHGHRRWPRFLRP